MAEFSGLDTNTGMVAYMQQQRKDRHARKPINTLAPVVSGSLTVGSVLSCTTGNWSGGAPYTFTYQWYRAGAAINGATSSTRTIAQTGQHYCVVTCTTVGKATNTAQSNTVTAV